MSGDHFFGRCDRYSFAFEGRLLVLETREDRAQIVGCTSMDDPTTRELVKAIMEGGEEAFQRWAEKYGGLRARS